MGYGEKRGDYYRGRYKIEAGKYGTVTDASGATARFRTKREAKQAADAEEVKVRAGEWVDPADIPTFGQYVNSWWKGQELAASTMENYPNHIEGHLLPTFGETLITAIRRTDIEAWEKAERSAGYAPTSVQTYRSILHLILQDAIEDIPAMLTNPATKRRGRGRRAGRSRARGPEKTVTDPLGALLIAERAALLSGRDDEFVMSTMIAYTGMRWGETVGLDRPYVRPHAIRVESQLYELTSGELVRCPPKDDSHRTIDSPRWLSSLLVDHIVNTEPVPCACHGARTVFRAAGLRQELRVPRSAIASLAGVGAATVSRVLHRPEVVTLRTQERVREAMAQLGVIEAPAGGHFVPHWGRDEFRHQVFAPAASGWYPTKGESNPAHPVCVVADPWPGTVIRGRWSAEQATACWSPVAAGLTPHGLRHCHSTWLEDLGIPKVLIDERMGHLDGSVSARYKHVLPGMRERLLAALTELWESALDARAAMSPRSPVAVLDRLLQERKSMILSRNSPQPDIRRLVQRTQSAYDLHGLNSTSLNGTSYFMKSPPVQYFDDEARENVEKFINGDVER